MAGANSKGMRKRGRGPSRVSPETTGTAPTKDEDAHGTGTGSDSTTTTTATALLWNRLREFQPIIGITVVVLVPYGLYLAYLFVCLQRPAWWARVALKGTIVRPSFAEHDARQVLIVGTMSSGTTQLAHELRTTLGLEIGHENSDTTWNFVRDGTVSWFHGIRFLPRPGLDDRSARVTMVFPLPPTNKETDDDATTATTTVLLEGEQLFRYVVDLLCQEFRPNMGFHPIMFRDTGTCSLRQAWAPCWKQECTHLLQHEWGCARRHDASSSARSSPSSCRTPYHTTLHQVRQPLTTVASLVTKFCMRGLAGEVQRPFVVVASALFPQHDFSQLSCIEAMGYYVYEYNQAMRTAVHTGTIDTRFPVEGATACQVATLAGFFERSEAGYPQQIHDHLVPICRRDDDEDRANTASNIHAAHRPIVSTKNRYNQGQLSLDWDDLLGGRHGSHKTDGDRDLQQRLQHLTQELGYQQ